MARPRQLMSEMRTMTGSFRLNALFIRGIKTMAATLNQVLLEVNWKRDNNRVSLFYGGSNKSFLKVSQQ